MSSDPLTVFVVDDNEAIRFPIRSWLEDEGFNVVDAAGGHEALAAADLCEGAIQLLLTDIDMPQMSGLELVARFQQTRPHTQVLLMSGAWKSTQPPPAPFLLKPFTRAELLSAVSMVLAACVIPRMGERAP